MNIFQTQRRLLLSRFYPSPLSLLDEHSPLPANITARQGVPIPSPMGILIAPFGLEGDCLLFRGKLNKGGYGRLSRGRFAHREAYRRVYGNGVGQVNHLCGRPSCFQPAHLYEGTKAQNKEDEARHHRLVPKGVIGRKLSDDRERKELSRILGPWRAEVLKWFKAPERFATIMDTPRNIWSSFLPPSQTVFERADVVECSEHHFHSRQRGQIEGERTCLICGEIDPRIIYYPGGDVKVIGDVNLRFTDTEKGEVGWEIVCISKPDPSWLGVRHEPGEFSTFGNVSRILHRARAEGATRLGPTQVKADGVLA